MVVNVTDKKNKLVEYRKKYYKMRKNALLQLQESILIYKIFVLYKGKYWKLFSFVLYLKKNMRMF